MFKIRQNQIEVLSSMSLQRNVRLISLSLMDRFGSRFDNEEETKLWVQNAVDQATKHGFKSVGEIERFVEVVRIMGNTFVSEDWAKSILDQELLPSTKANLLYEYALEKERDLLNKKKQLGDKKRRLVKEIFCKKNVKKLMQMSKGTIGKEFLTINDAFNWLLTLSTTAFNQGCSNTEELEIWLDLSLMFGSDFYKKAESQTIAKNYEMPRRLHYYMESLKLNRAGV